MKTIAMLMALLVPFRAIALCDAQIEGVREGLTKGEVLAKCNTPDKTLGNIWVYEWNGMNYFVTFENGVVTEFSYTL